MATTTSIEWTDVTWNPVTGCSKVSPGCAHCYAEVVAGRFWLTQYPAVPIAGADNLGVDATRPREFTDVQCHEDRLDQPLRWKKPRKVFVNSMSDLFHPAVPDAFLDDVFAVMGRASQHTFQVLTKRAERMRAYLRDRGVSNAPWPVPNVWLGVSVENQRFADERIPLLLKTPAAVRFLSCEPLLERLQLAWEGYGPYEYGHLRQGIDWVIVGGESGPGARPMDLAWARSIVQQCQAAGVPVFVKQLGAKPIETFDDGATRYDVNLRSKKGGDPAEWAPDLQVREFPEVRA